MFFPLFLQFAVWLLGSAGRFVNREISTGRLVNLFPQSTAASQSQLRILFLRDKKRGRTVELINSSYSSVLPTEVWKACVDACVGGHKVDGRVGNRLGWAPTMNFPHPCASTDSKHQQPTWECSPSPPSVNTGNNDADPSGKAFTDSIKLLKSIVCQRSSMKKCHSPEDPAPASRCATKEAAFSVDKYIPLDGRAKRWNRNDLEKPGWIIYRLAQLAQLISMFFARSFCWSIPP